MLLEQGAETRFLGGRRETLYAEKMKMVVVSGSGSPGIPGMCRKRPSHCSPDLGEVFPYQEDNSDLDRSLNPFAVTT